MDTLIKAMYGTRQVASAWQTVETAMCEIDTKPGQAPPCIFHQSAISGTGLVHGDDFVVVTTRKHAEEIEDHLRAACRKCRHSDQANTTRSRFEY